MTAFDVFSAKLKLELLACEEHLTKSFFIFERDEMKISVTFRQNCELDIWHSAIGRFI
jgi:hypothetical protein